MLLDDTVSIETGLATLFDRLQSTRPPGNVANDNPRLERPRQTTTVSIDGIVFGQTCEAFTDIIVQDSAETEKTLAG